MSEIKISLCMIVGNVEEYIERCLESFRPVAQEIVLVRAIGNLQPDRTIELAKAKYPDLVKVGEYRNKPEHADWPHVDDFAAARQLSFDLASGEYCFWADSDDILKEQPPGSAKTTAQIVHELAERGGYAVFMFPYEIFGRGVTVTRERMIMRHAGKWLHPVHEAFKCHLEPIHAVEDSRVVVVHMPHLNKHGSAGRNLRILKSIPDKDLTPGLLYHLQGELAVSGDIEGSVNAAKRALSHPDLGQPERYELFLNLAAMSEEPSVKESFLVQAYATDPRRREALGLLTCNALDYRKNDKALAYARQMMATAMPSCPEWNNRASAYGWVGEEIYTQALRVNGMEREAEIIRREMVKRAGGARIALLHATRGRPQQAAMARKIWLDLAEKPDAVEHIFLIDDDDPESEALKRMHHRVIPAGGGCVGAWNMGVFSVASPVLVQLSDDWIPVPQWDKLILERIGDPNKPAVLAVSDGVRNDDLLCMAICTRKYLIEDCFLFHPAFKGVFSDNWFTREAYRRGKVIDARDIRFVHNHPLKTGKPMDKTYAEQNSEQRYKEGQEIYNRLLSGKDWCSIPGWFDYWMVYQYIADTLKDGDTVAEVGVWLGRSITYLAQLLKSQGKKVRIIAVDSFAGEPGQVLHEPIVAAMGGSIRRAFEENIKRCGVDDMIEIIQGDSAESAAKVADDSLAFCFIDADHHYDAVKRDLAAWRPKVKATGILAGHDAAYPEVIKAVHEKFSDAQLMGPCWIYGPCWTATKPEVPHVMIEPVITNG